MPDERQKYDIDALRRSIPEDRGEYFLGFAFWEEDSEGWTRESRESLREGPARPLTRTVWNNPTDRDARVLIDVVECSSAADALEALVDRLLNNQLQQVPPGPGGLGEASFAHPKGVPPAIFFVRGNLCISVISFGRTGVALDRWADRVTARLADRPYVERWTLPLEAETPTATVGRQFAVRFSGPKKLDESGHIKFLVSGAAVVRFDGTQSGGRLILIAKSPGEVLVESIVTEPGRPASGGRLTVRIQ
jgi:hypothetical protein